MDTRESNIAWWIAGVLFLLLIVVSYLWLASKQDLATVLANGHDAISAEREQIQKDCTDTSSLSCRQDLSDLQNILQEFSDNLRQASSSATTSLE